MNRSGSYVQQVTGYGAFSSPVAVGLLEKLFHTPYISIKDVAQAFALTFQGASTLVAQFEKAHLLKEVTGRKRDKRYVYNDYLNLLAEGTR